jgi:hypothetical protein
VLDENLDDVEIIRVYDRDSQDGGFSLGNNSVVIRRVESFKSNNKFSDNFSYQDEVIRVTQNEDF